MSAPRPTLALYFALVFGVSWGGILAVIGLDGALGRAEIPEARLPLVYLATLLGPSVAALAATGFGEGVAGLRALGARLRAWRVPPLMAVVALLAAPVTMTGTLLALSTTDPALRPAPLTATPDPGLWLTAVFMGLVVGFCEELGWTGVAIPRLRRRLGLVPTGVLLGLIWGLWHLPLFSGAAAQSTDVPPALHLGVLLFSFLVPFRTLMVWVHDRTQSFWAVVLMHAPLAAGQLVLVPPALTGPQMVRYDLALAVVLWTLVAGVAAGTRRAERTAQPAG